MNAIISAAQLYITEFKRSSPFISNLKNDIYDKKSIRTYSDHYTKEHEIKKYIEYKRSFNTEEKSNEIKFRNNYVRSEIEHLDFNYFINYGTMYGWLENKLSETHKVIGLDRSEENQKLNREEFGKNIFEVSDNIFSYLENKREICNRSCFSMINIGTYFTPEYLRNLFEFLHTMDFKYVSIFEPYGFSIQTLSYYNPDENKDKDSVIFRGELILHNYPRLLKNAGFKITKQEILKPPHPTDPLFRSIYILGERT